MSMTLAARAAATDTVIGRFRHKPFDWSKSATCLHLARAQMRALGHKPRSIPPFRSRLGARKALKKAGFDRVLDLIDAELPGARIAPAAMWVGDLGLLPGEDGMEALVIAAGSKMLGWHGADLSRLHVIEVSRSELIAAWRL